MAKCTQCGKELSADEIGLTLKLINKNCTSYLCISCLAQKFKVTEDDLRDLVERLRAEGCTLFL